MSSALNIDALQAPVPGDDPTGPDLAYDPEFAALRLAAAGKPEQVMGTKIIPEVPPDWPAVREQAEALLGRTKDLRVAIYLTNAATRIDGLPGLNEGLKVIRYFLETWWPTVHPRLDPEDNNDPTERVNTLLALGDALQTTGAVMLAPIVRSRALGKFSYRDYLVAQGELPPLAADEGRVIDHAQIDGAFQDADLDEIQATAAALQGAQESLAGIESAIANQIGAPNGPDLSRQTTLLRDITAVVTGQLARRGVGQASSPSDARVTVKGIPGAINSRDDAVRALDPICDYFERQEPSSPVPLLLRRAQRLARMDFLQILRDMTPGGLAEAENIGGIKATD